MHRTTTPLGISASPGRPGSRRIGAAGVVVHAGSHLGTGRTAGLTRTRAAVMPLLDQLDHLADRARDQVPDLLIEFTAGKNNMLASRSTTWPSCSTPSTTRAARPAR